MEVTIDWRWAGGDNDPCWDWDRALYAYFADGRLVYVGKAEARTVYQRFMAPDKERVIEHLAKQIEGDPSRVGVLVGRPKGNLAVRVTKPLLRDLEGLLIYELKPEGNDKGKKGGIIRRPGVRVRCTGAWPFEQSVFHNA